MRLLDHEKLAVYRVSIELVILIDEIVEHLPRGRAYLADQLQSAGTSVPLNIAEGAGEYSSNEKIGMVQKWPKLGSTKRSRTCPLSD